MKLLKNNMKKNDVIFFTVALVVAAFLLAVDLITKQIIIDNLIYNGKVEVIKGFFSITHIRNTGAAWGIFSSKTDILSIVTVIAAVILVYIIYASTVNKPLMFCAATILGGALGNLIERLRLSYVTDFLAFNIFGYDFPNFNFADICITVGCLSLAFYIIFIHRDRVPLFRDGTFAKRLFGEK